MGFEIKHFLDSNKKENNKTLENDQNREKRRLCNFHQNRSKKIFSWKIQESDLIQKR